MSPPPKTPTPSRFLLPKRTIEPSQIPVPAPRFQSTPRFGSSSVLHSTQKRDKGIEDVDESDAEDDSEDRIGESPEDDQLGRLERIAEPRDPIEFESESASASSRPSVEDRDELGHDDGVMASPVPNAGRKFTNSAIHQSSSSERDAKRRRIDTPEPQTTDSPMTFLQTHGDEKTSERGGSIDGSSHTNHQEDGTSPTNQLAGGPSASKQPTFQAAPRFKPSEADTTKDALPSIFSPQRRGVKYLPGGLAAQLQGWLSNMTGDQTAGPVATIANTTGNTTTGISVSVEEVRPGRKFHLVSGRTGSVNGGGRLERFLLAGAGKLKGLGRGAGVRAGTCVLVEPPFWEVEVDGMTWTVTCDWIVQ